MKRIASFLVDHRKVIFCIMIVITIVCVVLTPKTTIITNMQEYLPEGSSMRKGLHIADRDFPKLMENRGEVRVMFQDLSYKERKKLKKDLGEIKYVDTVTYKKDSEEYNQIYKNQEYTLYELAMPYDPGTKEMNSAVAHLKDAYGKTPWRMTYSITNDTSGSLNTTVIILVVALLMGILFIMCASWLEPLLFLITIGMAVIINMGTNALLPNVSQTTHMIAGILQMVLSMDYSIILMNRFRQERALLSHDPGQAMKNAIIGGSKAIDSSAVTTIVGLLMLVFMSFKIGIDLGTVLAKGVLISMLCIFFVLPALVLSSLRGIDKTSKKSLSVNLAPLAGFSFKRRFAILGAFVVLLAGAVVLKGNTGIIYSSAATPTKIDKVFPQKNNIVLLYKNKKEAQIDRLVPQLKKEKGVDQVTSFGTTVGEKLEATAMADRLKDYGVAGEMQMDESLMKMIYYYHFKNGRTGKITLHHFLVFLQQQAAANDTFGKQIGGALQQNNTYITLLTNREMLTGPMTAVQLAGTLDMNPYQVKQVMLYYYMQNGGVNSGTMTVNQLVNFILHKVSKNPQYRSRIDGKNLAQLKSLLVYTDSKKNSMQRNYHAMASVLGTDVPTMRLLYSSYYAEKGSSLSSMTLPQLTKFLQNTVMNTPALAGSMGKGTGVKLKQLAHYTNSSAITRQQSAEQLAAVFGLDKNKIGKVLAMMGKTTMSEKELVDLLLAKGMVSGRQQQQLIRLQNIMNMTLGGVTVGYYKAAELFQIDSQSMKIIYAFHDCPGHKSSWTMSVKGVVKYILSNKSSLGNTMRASSLAQLERVSAIMAKARKGTQLSAQGMAQLLGMDSSKLRQIYLLKLYMDGKTDGWRLSPANFIRFLANTAVTNPNLSGTMPKGKRDSLTMANTLIEAVLSNQRYTASRMASLLSGMGESLDGNSVKLLYYYYFGQHVSRKNWKLSVVQLMDILAEDVIDDPVFDAAMGASGKGKSVKKEIKKGQEQLADAVSQLKAKHWSLILISTTLPEESAKTTAFMKLLTGNANKTIGKKGYHLIGNTPMNYEMAQSFHRELNKITLLTILAIFLVIFFTFRNPWIPIILVAVIQCAVYVMMLAMGLQGYQINYLALLIVQCILMGATIDYGILYTSYYREYRQHMALQPAMVKAYHGSIHTILTSGSIMTIVTFVISFAFKAPMVSQICRTLSAGAFCAILLILFLLPGLIAATDRWIKPEGATTMEIH